jgi:hypothetical protein
MDVDNDQLVVASSKAQRAVVALPDNDQAPLVSWQDQQDHIRDERMVAQSDSMSDHTGASKADPTRSSESPLDVDVDVDVDVDPVDA